MSDFVYVLKSEMHQTRYVGSTKNISLRLKEHNDGRCRYTSGRRPWKVLHQEEFHFYSAARKREKFLKSGVGRKGLDQILLHSLGDSVTGNTSGSGPEDSRFDP